MPLGRTTTRKNDPDTISDETLMARFKRGNTGALDQLIGRYKRSLLNFLWRRTHDEHEAQDVFQETWLRVITKAGSFKQECFRGWVFRIAHNLAVDSSRRRQKLVSLDVATPGPNDEEGQSLGARLEAKGIAPDDQMANRDVAQAIKRALMELPEEQRVVFLMRMEADMTFREIAEAEGIPLNTALARMQYALAKLRRRLDNYAPEGNDP